MGHCLAASESRLTGCDVSPDVGHRSEGMSRSVHKGTSVRKGENYTSWLLPLHTALDFSASNYQAQLLQGTHDLLASQAAL